MRFRKPFDEIFGRRSKVALLRYLVLSHRETTGRDLARSVGIDHKTCEDALVDLVLSDIVRRRGIGRAWVYTLNSGFPIVKEVLEPMFNWERELPDRYARDLWKRVERDALSIYLFGSTAKGTDDARSDIDLLIVTKSGIPIWTVRERLADVALDLMEKYGRISQHALMNAREFRAKFRKKHHFLMEILRTGRHLAGLRVNEILEHGAPTNRRPKGRSVRRSRQRKRGVTAGSR